MYVKNVNKHTDLNVKSLFVKHYYITVFLELASNANLFVFAYI